MPAAFPNPRWGNLPAGLAQIGTAPHVTQFADLVPGSPKWSFSEDRSRITRTLVIKTPNGWQDIVWAARNFLGWSEYVPGYGIKRTIPHSLPVENHAGADCLFATDFQEADGRDFAGVQLNDADTGQAFLSRALISSYKVALANVTYNTLPYDVLADDAGAGVDPHNEGRLARYTRRVGAPEIQYLSMPRQTVYWADPAFDAAPFTYPRALRAVAESVGRVQTSTAFKIRWYQVPAAVIRSRVLGHTQPYLDLLLGCTNSTVWPLANGSIWDIGRILYLGYHLEPHVSPFGDRTYDVELLFNYREEGVNNFFSPFMNQLSSGLAGADSHRAGYYQISADGQGAYFQPNNEVDGKRLYRPQNLFGFLMYAP